MNNLWYKNIQLGDIKSVNLDLNNTNLIDLNSGDQFVKTCSSNQSFILEHVQPKNFRLILTGGSLNDALFRASSQSIIVLRGIESIQNYDASSINIVNVEIISVEDSKIGLTISVKPESIVGDIDIEARRRISVLENNYNIYEIFTKFEGEVTTGTVYIPTEAEIFDIYGNSQEDILIVKADSDGNPLDELALNSSGNPVLINSFSSAGLFVLDSAPVDDYCLIYFIKIDAKYQSNVDESKIAGIVDVNKYCYVGVIDVEVPVFSNNAGTITINSSNVGLRSDINHVTRVKQYVIPQASFTLTDGVESYIIASYNNGNPIYTVSTNKTDANGSNTSLIYTMWRIGSIVHSANQDSIGLGLSNKINSRILNTRPYERSVDCGLIIAETTSPANRTITVSSAVVYKGIAREMVYSFASNLNNLTFVYHEAFITKYLVTSVYDNTYYDNGTNLVEIPSNKYSTRWYYRSIGDDREVFYVCGSNYYNTIAEAELESERTDLSVMIKNHCMLVGRSVIQSGASSGETVSAFTTQFSTSSVINHNETNNKQGGTTDEYYHLTATDYTDKILNRRFGTVASGNYTEFESTGFNKYVGSAKFWKDIDFPIIIRTTGTGIPTLVAINGNITMPQWAVNDYIQCESQEFVHEWEEGSTCYWHIHLTTNGSDVDNRYVRFELEYGYVSSTNVWTFPSVVTTNDLLIPTNTTSKTQIIFSIANFTPTGSKISHHAVARLKRVNSVGVAPTNNPWIPMLQMHVLCDSQGSRSIGTK